MAQKTQTKPTVNLKLEGLQQSAQLSTKEVKSNSVEA